MLQLQQVVEIKARQAQAMHQHSQPQRVQRMHPLLPCARETHSSSALSQHTAPSGCLQEPTTPLLVHRHQCLHVRGVI